VDFGWYIPVDFRRDNLRRNSFFVCFLGGNLLVIGDRPGSG